MQRISEQNKLSDMDAGNDTVLPAAGRCHRGHFSETQDAEEHATDNDDGHPEGAGGAAVREAKGTGDDGEFPGVAQDNDIAGNGDYEPSKAGYFMTRIVSRSPHGTYST